MIKHSRPVILIVDDQPNNIKILSELLGDEYTIKVATNGHTAIKITGMQDKPDLILLDVIMPEINGYDVCRYLKEEASSRNIPVIFITARDNVTDEEYGFSLGAVDYITKPFSPVIVKARVRTHVRLKQNIDLLESLAFLDGLTSIPNRRHFDMMLEAEWKRARRSQTGISILMADVDYFKRYNDYYGHGQGDECLRQIAAAMTSSLYREGDTAFRYGGEEFAVILPDTDLEGAREVAERIRSRVEALSIHHAESSVCDHVTISMGGYTLVPSGEEKEDLIVKQADRMLYDAKESGRNRVVCGEGKAVF